jgi:prepilin-type N-terminal cleavage/methylation domain-containing protein
MKIRRHNTNRPRAFTLIELLIVVGIIGLLVAIALPSFSNVKTLARVASTKALISTLSTGLDLFKADDSINPTKAYPPDFFLVDSAAKNPYTNINPTYNVWGAQMLVWALAGPTMEGTVSMDDLTTYGDRFRNNGGTYLHRGPYVDTKSARISKWEALSGGAYSGVADLPMFLDAFGNPILYYKAQGGTDSGTIYPFTATGGSTNPNLPFTSNARFGGPDANWDDDSSKDKTDYSFYRTINDNLANNLAGKTDANGFPPSGSYRILAPCNRDSYILLSAGPDGKYLLSPDDITNTKQK